MCTASWGWGHHRSLLKVREPLIPFRRAALQLHQHLDNIGLTRGARRRTPGFCGTLEKQCPKSSSCFLNGWRVKPKGCCLQARNRVPCRPHKADNKTKGCSSISSICAPAGLTKDLPGPQISQLVGRRLGKSSTGADGASTASIVSHSLSTSLTVSLLLKQHGWPGTCCLGQYLQTCTFGGDPSSEFLQIP